MIPVPLYRQSQEVIAFLLAHICSNCQRTVQAERGVLTDMLVVALSVRPVEAELPEVDRRVESSFHLFAGLAWYVAGGASTLLFLWLGGFR